MPAVVTAAASVFTAVSTAVSTAALTAQMWATSALIGAGVTTGAAIAITNAGAAIIGSAVVSAGINALAPKPKVSMQNQMSAAIGAISPTYMLAGRTITAGVSMVENMVSGKNNDIASYIVTLAHTGETGAVEAVKWGNDILTFDALGNCISPAKYAGACVLYQRSGSWTQTGMQIASINGFQPAYDQPSEWTSNHRALGCLTAWLVVRTWKDCWKNNSNQPQFICSANTCELYDPRTQALCTTWAQRQNMACWAYSWAKKWTSPTGVTVAGIGWTDSQIDIVSLAYWANVCETNGWKISAVIDCDPANKSEVMAAICQSGAAVPAYRAGKFSVYYAAPRTSVVTITEDDFCAKPKRQSNVPYSYRPNRLIPRYISEASNWNIVDGDAVTATTYLTEDGGEYKTETMEFPYAGGGNSHVGQLAAYSLANAREPFRDLLNLKPQARYKFMAGDCILINAPAYGYNNYKCLVTKRDFATDFTSQNEAVTETDSKHPFALGQTTLPPDFAGQFKLNGDYCPAPALTSWAVIAAQLTQGGSSIPCLKLSGASDFNLASGIVVRYRLNSIGSPWLGVANLPPTATNYEIVSITPNTSYILGVSYRNQFGVEGAITELSAVTTGTFVAGSAASVDWGGVNNRPKNMGAPQLQNPNADYDVYPNATGLPDLYTDKYATNPQLARSNDDFGGYAVIMSCAANTRGEFNQEFDINRVAGKYIVNEAEIELLAGTLSGSGVQLSNQWDSANTILFATQPDAYGNVVGNGVVGKRYYFSKIAKLSNTVSYPALWRVVGHFATWGDISQANQIKFHKAGWREATEAEIQAYKATSDIADIANDSILSKDEKPDLVQKINAIAAETTVIGAQATSLGIDAAPYYTAKNNLFAYAGGLTPYYADYTQNTPVVRATFNQKFEDYYTAKANIQNAISASTSNVALGQNQLVNSDLTRGKYGFGLDQVNAVAGVDGDFVDSAWWGKSHVIGGMKPGVLAAGAYIDAIWSKGMNWGTDTNTLTDARIQAQKFALKVRQNDRVFAMGQFAKHRLNSIQFFALFFDYNGGLTSDTRGWMGGRDGGSGANGDLANYDPLGGCFTVDNANSVFMQIMVRAHGSGESNPYWFCRDLGMGKVAAGQTVLPPYTSGPVDKMADETLASQIDITGLLTTTFDFAAGSPVAGQLPRTIQARAYKAGVEVTTGGTWSITNMVNCTVSVGASTGLESITALGGTGQVERSYVRVFTYNGIAAGQQKVTIAYNNTDTATPSSKAGVPRIFGNSISGAGWADISTNGVMSISGCPANGVVSIDGGILFNLVSGSNAVINLRLKIDGTVVYTSFAQTVFTGGGLGSFDFSDLFSFLYNSTLGAGAHTFSVEAQRVSGDAIVTPVGNLFVTVTGT